MVNDRGSRLRALAYEDLRGIAVPENAGYIDTEHVVVEGRRGEISIYVREQKETVRVVLQGFLAFRLFRFMKTVALDGFYKSPDGTMSPLTQEDLYEFG